MLYHIIVYCSPYMSCTCRVLSFEALHGDGGGGRPGGGGGVSSEAGAVRSYTRRDVWVVVWGVHECHVPRATPGHLPRRCERRARDPLGRVRHALHGALHVDTAAEPGRVRQSINLSCMLALSGFCKAGFYGVYHFLHLRTRTSPEISARAHSRLLTLSNTRISISLYTLTKV